MAAYAAAFAAAWWVPLLPAVVGFAAIHLLLRYLRTRSLMPFIYYRYAVAVITLVIAAIRVA